MHKELTVSSKNFRTSHRATCVGLVVTLLYLIILGAYVYLNWCKVSSLVPNEMGDFLAGAFGPIALLWLVCGYFQQGAELRQNTQALQLQSASLEQQVKELKLSVVHQAELADAAKEQLSFAVQQSRDAAERSRAMSRPNFFVVNFNPYIFDTGLLFRCGIENRGATVNVIETTCTAVLVRPFNGELRTAGNFNIEVKIPSGVIPEMMKEVTLTIRYRDNLGEFGSADIKFQNDSSAQAFRVSS